MTSLTHKLPDRALRTPEKTTPSFFTRLRRTTWRVLSAIGERRARVVLLQLARDHEERRPEFAAKLRETARRGWL